MKNVMKNYLYLVKMTLINVEIREGLISLDYNHVLNIFN